MLYIMALIPLRLQWGTKLPLLLLSSLVLLGSLPGTTALVLKPSTNEPSTYPPDAAGLSVCTSNSCKQTAETMIGSLNEKQEPCENFYEFACGGWIRKYSKENSNITMLSRTTDKSVEATKNLLESDVYDKSSAFAKARIYFHSCVRKEEKEENISKFLTEVITEMGGWHILPNTIVKKQEFDFLKLIIDVNNKSYNKYLLFEFGLNPENLILTLKRKDIDDKGLTDLNKVTKIYRIMGANETETRAEFKEVLKLRDELVKISEEYNDGDDDGDNDSYDDGYDDEEEDSDNIFTLQQWQNATPFLNWSEFFNSAFPLPNFTILYNKSIYVDDPEYFRRLGEVITKYNESEEGQKTLRNLMLWRVTLAMFDYLTGTETNEKQDSRINCAKETISMFPAPVGAVYVRKMFSNKTRGQVKIMSQNIRQAFKQHLKKAQWMEQATLQAALDRIDSIGETIGYSDFILNSSKIDNDFADLVVKHKLYYQNKLAYYEFRHLKYLKWLYEVLIHRNTEIDSSIVNQLSGTPLADALYVPHADASRIPASFIQFPFYDETNVMSVNYGALGMVIAHELMHGFSPFLHDWIPEEDDKAMTYVIDQMNCIVKQYTNYTIDGLHLNGDNTLEENIADNSGLKASYHAYLNYSKNTKVNYTLPGVKYNHGQQFFIAFAQMWCQFVTREYLRNEIETNTHSINKFRVIGSVSNMVEFAQEFNCPVGSKMNPKQKCTLW